MYLDSFHEQRALLILKFSIKVDHTKFLFSNILKQKNQNTTNHGLSWSPGILSSASLPSLCRHMRCLLTQPLEERDEEPYPLSL